MLVMGNVLQWHMWSDALRCAVSMDSAPQFLALLPILADFGAIWPFEPFYFQVDTHEAHRQYDISVSYGERVAMAHMDSCATLCGVCGFFPQFLAILPILAYFGAFLVHLIFSLTHVRVFGAPAIGHKC